MKPHDVTAELTDSGRTDRERREQQDPSLRLSVENPRNGPKRRHHDNGGQKRESRCRDECGRDNRAPLRVLGCAVVEETALRGRADAGVNDRRQAARP